MNDQMCDSLEVHGEHEFFVDGTPSHCPGIAHIVLYNQGPNTFREIYPATRSSMWDFLKPVEESTKPGVKLMDVASLHPIEFFYPEADRLFSQMLGESEILRWNSLQKPKHPRPEALRNRRLNQSEARRRRSELHRSEHSSSSTVSKTRTSRFF